MLPRSQKDIFAFSSILPSIKRLYPDHNIYFFTNEEYFEILDGNPNVHKVLKFQEDIDDSEF